MAASDFSNVRAESKSYDAVIIRYTYAGAGAVSLYRSTDNSSFSLIYTIPAAYGTYPTLTDVQVASATLYYYKLSDDSGSTFSSTVTVKTQVQFPVRDTEPTGIALPTFTGDADVDSANLDAMRSKLEAYINGDRGAAIRKNCQVCPVNGALVLDCADGCYSFTVEAADIADINSISINCEALEVIFNIPGDGTTPIEVCGWSTGAGFGGDECYQAPISNSVNFPIRMIQEEPCAKTTTYHTSAPCKGDYVYECYDPNSLFRLSGIRAPAPTSCNCSSFFNGIISKDSNGYDMLVKSGMSTGLSLLSHVGMAGISIYYKSLNTSCVGAPAAGNIYEYIIGGVGSDSLLWTVTGSPIFGFAINVPVGVTYRSFTGDVLLFDYPNDRYLWGSYSNADLHAGAMPTSIGSIAMSAITPTKITLTIDGTPGDIYSLTDVQLDNASQSETLPLTAIAVSGEPTGFGVIWVANNNIGNHTARIVTGYEQSMIWWG